MKLSGFKTDPKKAAEGVVHNFDAEGKAYIRVMRANNPKFEKELRRLLAPYKGTRANKIPPDVATAATKEAMGRFVLVEIAGLEDDLGDITGTRGALIPDTDANRIAILKSEHYGEFLELVSSIAQSFDQFRVESEEEELGNSAAGSGGSGPGAGTKDS